MTKYKKLIVLVHPLWYFVRKYNELKNKDKNFYKKVEPILKVTLKEYKRVFNAYSKTPDTCFVLMKPEFKIPENIDVYEKFIQSFMLFARKKLGSKRFLVTDYIGEESRTEKPLFSRDVYLSFDKNITMFTLGEMREWCVRDAEKAINHELSAQGIKVKESKILLDSTLYQFQENLGLNRKINIKLETTKPNSKPKQSIKFTRRKIGYK